MIPGFNVVWGDTNYTGEDIIYRTERQRSPQGIWTGKDNVVIQKCEMIPTPPALPISLSGITLGMVVNMQEGMVNVALNTTIEKVSWGQQSYGPMNTQVALKRLTPHITKALMTNLNQMQLSGKYLFYLHHMKALVPELLKTRPELHIDNMWLRTSQGVVKGRLQLAVGGKDAYQFSQLNSIVDSLFASAGILMPQAWVKEMLLTHDEEGKVEAQIATYIQTGILIPQDDSYLMDLRYENGVLTLNGKPWPPVPPRNAIPG